MKKALIALLSLIMCFALFSCTQGDNGDSGNKKEDHTFKGDIETPFVDLEFN